MSASDLDTIPNIAARLGIPAKRLYFHAKHGGHDFPMVMRQLGRYKFYNVQAVIDWWTLWEKATKNAHRDPDWRPNE